MWSVIIGSAQDVVVAGGVVEAVALGSPADDVVGRGDEDERSRVAGIEMLLVVVLAIGGSQDMTIAPMLLADIDVVVAEERELEVRVFIEVSSWSFVPETRSVVYFTLLAARFEAVALSEFEGGLSETAGRSLSSTLLEVSEEVVGLVPEVDDASDA